MKNILKALLLFIFMTVQLLYAASPPPIQSCFNCSGTVYLPLPSTGAGGNVITSTSGSPSNTFYINHDVFVNSNVVLKNCEINVANNKKITVQKGATLTLIHCHIATCEPIWMWQGIEVQPFGSVSVLQGSFIEDAKVAINFLDPAGTLPYYPTTLLDVESSIFNRNDISIEMTGYNLTSGGGIPLPLPITIKGCLFTCRYIDYKPCTGVWPSVYAVTAPIYNSNQNFPLSSEFINDQIYDPGYVYTPNIWSYLGGSFYGTNAKPTAGILLNHVGYCLIQNNPSTNFVTSYIHQDFNIGAANPDWINTFDNLQAGINATASYVHVVNSLFQNTIISPTNARSGYGLDIEAGDIYKGNLIATSPTGTSPIDGNRFIDCHTAIYTTDLTTTQVNYSYIRSSQQANTYTLSNIGFSTVPISGSISYPNHLGKFAICMLTGRLYNYDIGNNQIYNIENGIYLFHRWVPGGMGGGPPNGQMGSYGFGVYSGQLDIYNNTFDKTTVGSAPIPPNQFIYQAIQIDYSTLMPPNLLTSTQPVNPLLSPPYNSFTTFEIGSQGANQATYVPLPNIINQAYNGIAINSLAGKNVHTSNNQINLLPMPPAMRQTGFIGQMGIQYVNTTPRFTSPSIVYPFNLVWNNRVTAQAQLPNSMPSMGYYSNSANHQHIECNNFSNTNEGMEFNQSCLFTVINRNQMYSNSVLQAGLELNNAANIGTQGSPGNPTDNQWYGTWGSTTVQPFMTSTVASSAVTQNFFLRSVAPYNPNGFGYTSITPGVTNYFSPSTLNYTSGASIGCGPGMAFAPSPIANNTAALYDMISGASAAYSPHPAETNFILQNNLYRMLRSQPDSTLTDSTVNAFYQANLAGSSYETFVEIDSLIAISDLINAQTMISAFSPTNNVEQNYQNYYNWALSYLDTTLATADTLGIRALAMGCPYYDGDVVYWAQTLYKMLNLTDVVSESNCNTSDEDGGDGERKIKINKTVLNQQLASLITIYPNPANNNINITLPTNNDSNYKIECCDIQGKTISSVVLNCNSTVINTANYANGICILCIINLANNEKIYKKVVIQHGN